jgi:hypothetical protein
MTGPFDVDGARELIFARTSRVLAKLRRWSL